VTASSREKFFGSILAGAHSSGSFLGQEVLATTRGFCEVCKNWFKIQFKLLSIVHHDQL